MRYNRLIAFILVLAMLLCLGAAAETYQVETSNKGPLNLRSVKDNTVIRRIPNGTLLEPDPENPVRTSLTGNQTLARCGMENIYLSIMDFTTVSGSSTAEETLDAAVAMAHALVDAG